MEKTRTSNAFQERPLRFLLLLNLHVRDSPLRCRIHLVSTLRTIHPIYSSLLILISLLLLLLLRPLLLLYRTGGDWQVTFLQWPLASDPSLLQDPKSTPGLPLVQPWSTPRLPLADPCLTPGLPLVYPWSIRGPPLLYPSSPSLTPRSPHVYP